MRLYDTNILLSHLEVLENDKNFLISSVTIKELENIKSSGTRDEATKYSARKAVRWLRDNQDKYRVVVYESLMREKYLDAVEFLDDNNDLHIILCATWMRDMGHEQITFVTNDMLCRIIATEYLELDTESVEDNANDIYKGYRTITGSSDEINKIMELMDLSGWNVNEYLIIENTDDNTTKELRFDGKEFVSLKLPSSRFIKAKNSLQRCALDILNNPDITIAAILGGYGSGKTFISMQMALYNVQEKGRVSRILGVREVMGQGKDVGYLPGDLEDKVGRFFDPLTQSLNGGEYELQSLKTQGILDVNVPFFMKGTTYNDTIILCDEAEDLSESQIRLIGTRLGTNSKIFLAGDYKQSLLKKTIDNPLIKMCNEFKGNGKFACIYLGEDVRSDTSRMFADLFEK